jgi:type IV pilus assembly protein PilM
MAINFTFGRNKTINITIKDHAIRFVELKQTQPAVVQRMGERYLPAGLIKEGKIMDYETLSTVLEQCIFDWKIAKRNVRFLVPDSFVVIRMVSIPIDLKEDEIKGYLYMEIGTSIHLPFEDPVFDYVVMGNSDVKNRQILLFAAPEDIVREYMGLFDEVKLKAVAADISSLALYRYYNQIEPSSENQNLLLIQFDLQEVNVSIIEKNIPVFMRHITMEVNREKWTHSLTNESFFTLNYTGDKEEAYISIKDAYSQIEKVINFYQYSLNQGKQQVGKIILDGDHPWLGEIHSQLDSRFGIPTLMIASVNEDKMVEPIPPQFHLNVGLGLKEV